MFVTKGDVAEKLIAYLHHELPLAQLVDWAETALMEGEMEENQPGCLAAIIGRLGVADVRAFGLSWEDCEEALRDLGYSARVEVSVVS